MSSVDDRIVNMKFNNAQFGKGVNESKRDLTGLEKTITTAGKAKGMTTLGSGVQAVATKFSALQVVGVAALGTITAKATSAGLSLLKKFTIQPLIDGFKEYQTGLESVQTIMSNTGRPVREVNKALDQLNDYADQTIYNFGQMAKNVGTFTAAGVDLKTSVASIKGIANLAALSGSNSQQAATAMYQLSQAISAGKVGLQDWNSVVNAGMGGKIFQTALTRTAVNMGTLNKGAINFEGTLKRLTVNGQSFRQSIAASPGTESYLTGDVLVETLKQISGGYTIAELRAKGFSKQAAKDIDELARKAFNAATKIKTLPQLLGVIQESIGSTFAEGFRIVLGDFQQSKKLWTGVAYEIIGPHGFLTRIQDHFTGMLKGWAENGGRDKVLAGFGRLFKGLGRIAGAFRDAFTTIFPPTTGDQLYRISKAFKQFMLNFRTSKDTAEDLKSIFGGFFAVIHIGISIVKAALGAFSNFFGALFDSSEKGRNGITSFLASVGDILIAFDAWLTKGGRLNDFFGTLGTVVGAAFAPILAVVGLVAQAIAALAGGEGIDAIAAPIDRITNGFLKFVEFVLGGLAAITAPFEGVSSMFADLQDKISGMSGNFASVLEPLTNLNFSIGGNGAGIFDTIIQGAKDLGDAIKNAFSDIDGTIDKFSGSMSQIGDAADVVKGKTAGVYDEITGAGADAASDSLGKVSDAAGGLGDNFGWVIDVVKGIGSKLAAALGWMADKLSNIPFPGDALEWATLLNALISGALIKRLFFSKGLLGTLSDTIAKVGRSITDTFGEMQETLKAQRLLMIAGAIALLVASLIALSFVPAEKIGYSLGALGAVMGLLVGTMKALEKVTENFDSTKMLSAGAAILLMSVGILAIAGAVRMLAKLDLKQLGIGIGAVAVLLTLLTGAIFAIGKSGPVAAGAGAAMLLMATALNVVVGAVAMLGKLDPKTLSQGIGAVAKTLGMMTLALVVLSHSSAGILAAGAAMVLVATSLDILTAAIVVLGLIPADQLQKGLDTISYALLGMTASLLILAAAGPSTLAAGAAMLMLAGAMSIMVSSLVVLAALPYDAINKGLYAMAAAFAILLISALLAQTVIPGLAALSSIISAIGLAMLAAGAGFFLFATGLSLLVALGAAGIAVITLAIGAFIALLPNIAIQVAAAFVAFVQTIALAAPKLRKAFGTIFENFIGTIRDNIPHIVGLFKDLIKAAGDAIIASINVIERVLRRLLDAGISVIRDYFPQFVLLGYDLIINLLEGLEERLPKIVTAATNVAIAFITSLGENAVKFANAGADVLIKIINGLADAVETKGPLIREAMGNLAEAIGRELRAALGDVLGAINPMNYLPDVDIKGWAASLNPLGRIKAGGRGGGGYDPFGLNNRKGEDTPDIEDPLDRFSKAIQEQARAVVAELSKNAAALGILKNAVDLNSKQLQQRATYMQTVAESRQSSADIATESADTLTSKASDRLDKAKGMKKSNPKRKKEIAAAKKQVARAEAARKAARKEQAAAAAAQQKADLAQMKADYEAQKERDAIQFKTDPSGLGDAKSQQSNDLSTEAAALAAQAQARRDEATRLENLAKNDKKNSKKYREQARELRKQAEADTNQSLLLSAQAIEAQAAAAAAYAEARKKAALDAIASMAEIRKQQEEREKQRAWQAAYDAADDATKKQMLATRKAENEEKARVAEAALAAALAVGDNLAAKIAAGGAVTEEELAAAQAAADEAARQAQIAADARDAAKADQDAIDQMNDQAATDNTTGGGGVTPSRSVLEDAANAVDRYTASVQQAEEAAAAGASTTQFVQNNYSPEALSNAQIYRQTNNLISAATIQIDAKKQGGPTVAPVRT